MNTPFVPHDERTIAVENASYRWAYLVMSFGLLILVVYRSLVLQEANWDLFALVVLGGLVATLYQGAHRILSRRWALVMLIAMIMSAVIAVVVVVVLANLR
jgi:hypothetical protein